MSKRTELLLVDTSRSQRAILQHLLGSYGFAVTPLPCLRQAAAALAVQRFDHAVLDLRLPDRKGLDLVRTMRGRCPQARTQPPAGTLLDAAAAHVRLNGRPSFGCPNGNTAAGSTILGR